MGRKKKRVLGRKLVLDGSEGKLRWGLEGGG